MQELSLSPMLFLDLLHQYLMKF
ncbi:hypothetical protein Ahy_A02g007734 isoform C [Arachis hypogaea]|uniref:Uncharacterized protein n=1 Tax=Arachis hypogaea TaxID=3818 RepID=A0A445ED96_ARAHY|nr:hypothetical protein Ahy_A02g007734 isoform C [Arachis hypogaea]